MAAELLSAAAAFEEMYSRKKSFMIMNRRTDKMKNV